MENKFTKFTKYFLGTHILLFGITIIYLITLRILNDHFHMFDYDSQWASSYMREILFYLLFIQVLLYWFKFFVILPAIVIIFYRPNVSRMFYIYLIITCLTYISIEVGLVHLLFKLTLRFYDSSNFPLNHQVLALIFKLFE
jgi:hypothetical protein